MIHFNIQSQRIIGRYIFDKCFSNTDVCIDFRNLVSVRLSLQVELKSLVNITINPHFTTIQIID